MTQNLDAPYDPTILSAIRQIIHNEIVLKKSTLNRHDYQIYFDPDMKNDLSFAAGNPMKIIIKCSAYDGPTVMRRCLDIFVNKRKIIKNLRHAKQVVRQKDGMVWYGIDFENIYSYQKKQEKMFDAARYTSDVIDTLIVVRVTDNLTGRKATATTRKGDAFSVTDQLIQQLREL